MAGIWQLHRVFYTQIKYMKKMIFQIPACFKKIPGLWSLGIKPEFFYQPNPPKIPDFTPEQKQN